jgi:hypothetical protein
MRQWQGIRDDVSQVGSDAPSLVVGMSFYVDGELSRRPGLSYLYAADAIGMGTFKHPVTGAWLAIVGANGDMDAINLGTLTLSSLSTGLNVEKRPNVVPFANRVYFVNDFTAVKEWDGVRALGTAGITGPTGAMGSVSVSAAGNITDGTHLLRYRYIDSTSPAGSYQSNPSDALEITTVAASTGSLTFNIGVSGPIVASTDPKVDTIQVEMTLADGSTYWVANTALNTASTITISISDTDLANQVNQSDTYGDYGHELPPLAATMFECRGYAFLCGTTIRTRTVGVTSSSATVTGTNFSTQWAGRLIRFGSQTTAYEIQSATATVITLTKPYVGSTGSITGVIYSKNPNRVYWSAQYLPESWKPLERAREVLSGYGDMLVGGCDFQGDAWFFGQRSMARLVFPDQPTTGETNPVPGYHGLWNARTLMPLDGILFGWGPNGAWVITGGAPRWLSRGIETTLRGLIDSTQSDLFFAAYDPVQKEIRWFFVAMGDTTCRYSITYEVGGQRWRLDQYRQGIDAGCAVADADGRLHLVVSDATNGMTWYHEGDTDGVPDVSTGSYTIALGSTTSALKVNQSLPTGTGTDLSKLIAYRATTGETSVITSNTIDTINLATAWTTSPSVGEAVYVGSIPCSYLTGWWVAQDLVQKSRPDLQLLLNPSTTGTVRVKVYRDFETSPEPPTTSADDTWPDGVTITPGLDYVDITLQGGASTTDGFVPIPLPADWGRAWRAQVECLNPAGMLRILDFRFVVTARSEQGTEERE